MLRPEGSSLPSFRIALRQWLVEMFPFASLDDQTKTVRVLLDQDPDFGCYSLLGIDWTTERLSETTADEDAGLVMEALEKGRQNEQRAEYVSDRLSKMDFGLSGLAQKSGVLAKTLEETKPLRVRWWKNLDKIDLGAQRSVIRVSGIVEEPGKSKRSPHV